MAAPRVGGERQTSLSCHEIKPASRPTSTAGPTRSSPNLTKSHARHFNATPPVMPEQIRAQVDPQFQRTVVVASKFDNRLKEFSERWEVDRCSLLQASSALPWFLKCL